MFYEAHFFDEAPRLDVVCPHPEGEGDDRIRDLLSRRPILIRVKHMNAGTDRMLLTPSQARWLRDSLGGAVEAVERKEGVE